MRMRSEKPVVLSEKVFLFWRISTKKDLPQEQPRNTTENIK
jgi:hypothetical protein